MAKQKTPWTSKLTLVGVRPIMFDRNLGDNSAKVANQDKMYKKPDGTLYYPSINFMSFLSAVNTRSAPRVYFPVKNYRDKAAGCLGFTLIDPDEIPLTRNGEPIVWNGEFDEDKDSGPSGIYLRYDKAVLKGGIPNAKERPVITLPWEITMDLTLMDNDIIKPDEFVPMIERGAMQLGFGTFRGVFGKARCEWS